MFKKGVASLLTVVLIGTSAVGITPLYAQGVETGLPLAFKLPGELGAIDDYYLPNRAEGSAPFIFHIQDAHADPEAQARIREIIQTLKPDLVSIEGSSGPLHPEYLNLIPAFPRINRAVVESLASKGELTGAELAAWEESQSGKGQTTFFAGAETPELYRNNLKAFRTLLFKRDEISTLLISLRKALEMAESRILSPELRRFTRERERRKEGDYGNGISSPEITAYVNFLVSEVKEKLGIDLRNRIEQIRFPNLVRIVALEKLEKEFDREKARAEETELLKRLGAGAEDPAKSEDPRSAAEALWRLAPRKGISLNDYPEYLKSIGGLILQSEVEPVGFFQEMERLEKWLVDQLATREEEKRLIGIVEDFGWLEKLLHLELTRDEFNQAVEKKEALRPGELSKRLKSISSVVPSLRAPKGRSNDVLLERYFDSAFAFYDGARRRDQSLLENTLELARKQGAKKVALVTGGFHTEGLMKQLKSAGLGYAVIRPRMTGTLGDDFYEKVLRNENADLSSYFKESSFTKQEALFLKSLLEVAAPLLWKEHLLSHAEISRQVARVINEHPVLGNRFQSAAKSYAEQSVLQLSPKKSSAPLTAKAVGDTALLTDPLVYDELRPPKIKEVTDEAPIFIALAPRSAHLSVREVKPVTLQGKGFILTSGPLVALKRPASSRAPSHPPVRSELRVAELVVGAIALGVVTGIGFVVFRSLRKRALQKREPESPEEALDFLIDRFLLGNPKIVSEQKRVLSDSEVGRRVARYRIKQIKDAFDLSVVKNYIATLESLNFTEDVIRDEANKVIRMDPSSKVPKTKQIHRIHDTVWILTQLATTKIAFLGTDELRKLGAVREKHEEFTRTVRQIYMILRHLEIMSNYSVEQTADRERLRQKAISGRSEMHPAPTGPGSSQSSGRSGSRAEVRSHGWLSKEELQKIAALFTPIADGQDDFIAGIEKVEVLKVLAEPKEPLGEIEKNPTFFYPYLANALSIQQWHTRSGNGLVRDLAEDNVQENFRERFEDWGEGRLRILSVKGGGILEPGELLGRGSALEVDWLGDLLEGRDGVIKSSEPTVSAGLIVEKDGAIALPDTDRLHRGQKGREVLIYYLAAAPKWAGVNFKMSKDASPVSDTEYNLNEMAKFAGKKLSDLAPTLKIGILVKDRHREVISKLIRLGIPAETDDYEEMKAKVEKEGYYWNGNLLLLKNDLMWHLRLYFETGGKGGKLDVLVGAGGPNQAEIAAHLAKAFGGKLLALLVFKVHVSANLLLEYNFEIPVQEIIEGRTVWTVLKANKRALDLNAFLRTSQERRSDRVRTENDLIRSRYGVFHVVNVDPEGYPHPALPSLDGVGFDAATGKATVHLLWVTGTGGAVVLRFTVLTRLREYIEKIEELEKELATAPNRKKKFALIEAYYEAARRYARFREFPRIKELFTRLWTHAQSEEEISLVKGLEQYYGVLETVVSNEIRDSNKEALRLIRESFKLLDGLPDEATSYVVDSPSGIITVYRGLLLDLFIQLTDEKEKVGKRQSELGQEAVERLRKKESIEGLKEESQRNVNRMSSIEQEMMKLQDELDWIDKDIEPEIEDGRSEVRRTPTGFGAPQSLKRSASRAEVRSEMRWLNLGVETGVVQSEARQIVQQSNPSVAIRREVAESLRAVARSETRGIYADPEIIAAKVGISRESAFTWLLGELLSDESGMPAVWKSEELSLMGELSHFVKPGVLPSAVVVRFTNELKISNLWLPLLKFLSANREFRLILEVEGVNRRKARELKKGLSDYAKRFGLSLRPTNLEIYPARGASLHRASERVIAGGQYPVGLLFPGAESQALKKHVRRLLRVDISKVKNPEGIVGSILITAARLQALPKNLIKIYTPEDLAQASGIELITLLERLARLSEFLATQA